MSTPTKMKRHARLLAVLAAIMLTPSHWNTANAQAAISFSLTGTGTGTLESFSLTGSGTVNPFGQTSVTINGGTQSGGFGIGFQVAFSDGSTITATSSASRTKNVITGSATITSGTGLFAGVTNPIPLRPRSPHSHRVASLSPLPETEPSTSAATPR